LPDHPIAESSIPSPEAVRQQLQALLASRPFVTATRARRFLTYVVEQTLAGETDAIKELVLGIEVFDRPADFDPKVDTIVRVEAGKCVRARDTRSSRRRFPSSSRSPKAATFPSSWLPPQLPPR
jgi:hypothetical protein